MKLPYDQIPKERLAIGDLADPLYEELGVLNVNRAVSMAREASKAGPEVRRAANSAIDAMLGELHALHARSVAEIRASDDASAVRADAMLRRRDGPERP